MEDEDPIKHINFEISNIKETNPLSGIFDSSYKDFSLERSRQQKLEKAIYYAKVLSIAILNLEVPLKTLQINALGTEVSLRHANDGFTYFGSKKRNTPKGQIINDVVLPFLNKDLAKNYRGSHFQISYDVLKDIYYIKDLKLGFGTFAKLKGSINIKNNTLVLLGDNFILINFVPLTPEVSRLRLKVYGKYSGDVFYFNASDYLDNCINIGRHESCEVKLQGSLVSKVHCTIFFTPEKGWVLCDGNVSNHLISTNGTWIYINENLEIYDSMIFKSGRIMFQVYIL